MITLNGTTELNDAALTESHKLHNLSWVKVLVVALPKADYTLQQAIDLIKPAKTITQTTDDAVLTYYLDGMMTAKEDESYCSVWMFNSHIVRQENVNQKLFELEQTMDTLLGGDENV